MNSFRLKVPNPCLQVGRAPVPLLCLPGLRRKSIPGGRASRGRPGRKEGADPRPRPTRRCLRRPRQHPPPTPQAHGDRAPPGGLVPVTAAAQEVRPRPRLTAAFRRAPPFCCARLHTAPRNWLPGGSQAQPPARLLRRPRGGVGARRGGRPYSAATIAAAAAAAVVAPASAVAVAGHLPWREEDKSKGPTSAPCAREFRWLQSPESTRPSTPEPKPAPGPLGCYEDAHHGAFVPLGRAN